MRNFSDGSVITAMRQNAGLSVEALAAAVGCSPAFIHIMETRRGIVSGSMIRKMLRHLISLKAHRRVLNVVVRNRPQQITIPIAWSFSCGALTGKGTPCRHKVTYDSGRCKYHGGLSTGPKTEAGKDRIREGQRKRRERERAE